MLLVPSFLVYIPNDGPQYQNTNCDGRRPIKRNNCLIVLLLLRSTSTSTHNSIIIISPAIIIVVTAYICTDSNIDKQNEIIRSTCHNATTYIRHPRPRPSECVLLLISCCCCCCCLSSCSGGPLIGIKVTQCNLLQRCIGRCS